MLMIDTPTEAQGVILDAQFVAAARGASHKVAKGRSKHRWLSTPSGTIEREVIMPIMQACNQERLRQNEEKARKFAARFGTWMKPDNGEDACWKQLEAIGDFLAAKMKQDEQEIKMMEQDEQEES